MCGLTGFLGGLPAMSGDEMSLRKMAGALYHRGPDDGECWWDSEQRIGLAHRRLAILELSPAGRQPMRANSGRYVIVFNGEIYNHLLLRQLLAGAGRAPAWLGGADTETLLACFDAWGIQETVERAIGMFAFAVWDRNEQTLTLARDRLGEKPLYYGWQGQGEASVFLFGSELKALRAHPAFENKINRGALCLQLRHSYIPAPHSIYEGIAKLMPGRLLTVSIGQRGTQEKCYWSGSDTAVFGVANSFDYSPKDAVDKLDVLLRDAVLQQMTADVPLGAFLSGGVDSSTIVALMQAQTSRPVKTFTIGFHEEGYNEAEYARAVAKHLGTEHTELYVSPEQAMGVIPRLPILYDEPFSDSSQIPTFLVSQLARQQVTVSLSGDAGDELFCGYNRYKFTNSLWRKLAMLPLPLRKIGACGLTSVPAQTWDKLANSLKTFSPHAATFANTGEKLHKAADVLASKSIDALYLRLVSHWCDPASLVIGPGEPPTLLTEGAPCFSGLDQVHRMMALDMLTYLPDDILVKVDRAAMGVSLETRVPFLDHRVVEYAWRLPQSLKLRDGKTKWALRQVLYRYVPASLIERPKMGFGVPIGAWLRGPLREWAETLLNESRLKNEGFFEPEPIRRIWAEHLSAKRNWEYHLWDVLMFQAWFENQ